MSAIHQYVVIYRIVRGRITGFAPDFPGCIGSGSSLVESRESLHDEIQRCLHGMKRRGEAVPEPSVIHADLECNGLAEWMPVRVQARASVLV